MFLWLVRHGEKEPHARDVAKTKLTDKGHRQADILGKRLKDENIDIIFSSTMTRAKQTSDEINKYINVRIEYRDELKEIDRGVCDKNDWEYVCANYPDFVKEHKRRETDVKYPGGECGEDVWIRAHRVISEISVLGLKNIAVVTHGGTIRCIICGVLGLPMAKRSSFGLPPEHCSITCIMYVDNRKILHIFNDYAHLQYLPGLL